MVLRLFSLLYEIVKTLGLQKCEVVFVLTQDIKCRTNQN